MTVETKTRPASAAAAQGPRQTARRVLRRLARPFLRRRGREAELAAALGRLQGELEHVRDRHGEQIERLEELVRELIATSESLRRAVAGHDDDGERR
ncbi:MAG TPA: hypothetical protein VGN08_01310 [Solirubrobacteraceae bacterium]|jgi:predicted  nucleic acid-binding Zn-ribbon protein